MKPCVYILRNDSGTYYIGSTGNFSRRLEQHKHGYAQTTKRLRCFDPVLVQEYATLASACAVERKLKKMKRKDYIDKIVRDGHIKIVP